MIKSTKYQESRLRKVFENSNWKTFAGITGKQLQLLWFPFKFLGTQTVEFIYGTLH